MRSDLFPTTVYYGHIDISEKIIKEYKEWAKFEKELAPSGADQTTTQRGWQYIFAHGETEPDWLKSIAPQLNEIKQEVGFVRAKTMWVVDYQDGGYQDPHFHSVGIVKVATVILNILGKGELVIQDPRQLAMGQGYGFASEVVLNPGDWYAMPAYLIHNSRPATRPQKHFGDGFLCQLILNFSTQSPLGDYKWNQCCCISWIN